MTSSEDDGFRVPREVVAATHEGRYPMRARREHRQSTQDALAALAKLGTPCLSQIEDGLPVAGGLAE